MTIKSPGVGTSFHNLKSNNKLSNINFKGADISTLNVTEIGALNKAELPLLIKKTKEEAQNSGQNCMTCKKPKCKEACLVEQEISKINGKVKKRRMLSAIALFAKNNIFFTTLCALCEKPCEIACIKNKKGNLVGINNVEKMLSIFKRLQHIKFMEDKNFKLPPTGKKVAVVGSGIAGLTAAAELARFGHKVTIFEALPKEFIGGQLSRTIPNFRFDKARWLETIETIKKLGVKIIPDCKVGQKYYVTEGGKRKNIGDRINFDRLTEVYDAVFVHNGACLQNVPDYAKKINIPNVHSADEFLERFNTGRTIEGLSDNIEKNKDKVVVVSGGGNVAIDAARSAIRKGCQNVIIMYRKGLEQMSAHQEEIEHALKDKVKIFTYHDATEFIQENGKTMMKYTYIDKQTGKKTTNTMNIDAFVFAHGSKTEPIKTNKGTLPMNENGRIDVDHETHKVRGYDNVYASGDNTADIQKGGANAVSAVKSTMDTVECANNDLSGRGSKQALRQALKNINKFRNKISGNLNKGS